MRIYTVFTSSDFDHFNFYNLSDFYYLCNKFKSKMEFIKLAKSFKDSNKIY